MRLHRLSDSEVHSGLKKRSQAEREILSEIVRFICEVDRRRLFEKFGYPSLFEYLVKEMKYSNGSAQRRIDAARLLKDVPELITELESGTINLTHTSAVAHGFKQKKKELKKLTSTVEVKANAPICRKSETDTKSPLGTFAEEKRELLEKVKGQTLSKTQEFVAQSLNLEIKAQEKKTMQKDGSVRLEITFTREEAELLQKAKDILSHSCPGATATEVLVKTLSDFVQRKNPATKGILKQKKSKDVATSTMEVKTRNLTSSNSALMASTQTTSTVEVKTRTPIKAAIRREVFQKQTGCQWKDLRTGKMCGSTFQLQADHRKPVWAGGTSESENLQPLCSAHNQMKYKLESGQLRIF